MAVIDLDTGPADADDWAGLSVTPEIQPDPDNDSTPDDKRPRCEECNNVIPWSGRGRKPKRCAEHKNKPGSSSAGPARTTSRGTGKAEREAKEIADAYLVSLRKLSLFVAMVDPFDGQALFAASASNAQLFQGVLLQHDKLRASIQQGRGGSSTVAFIVSTIVTIVLPIAAHHGIIPAEVNGKPVGDMLMAIPDQLSKLNASMQRASDDATLHAMREAAQAAESAKDAA